MTAPTPPPTTTTPTLAEQRQVMEHIAAGGGWATHHRPIFDAVVSTLLAHESALRRVTQLEAALVAVRRHMRTDSEYTSDEYDDFVYAKKLATAALADSGPLAGTP